MLPSLTPTPLKLTQLKILRPTCFFINFPLNYKLNKDNKDIKSAFLEFVRLPENTPASQARQLSIEAHTGTPPAADWKRPPGRPRRNWLQQVEEDVGLSVGAAWIAGQDRSMWRTLRPSAGQAQQ